MVALQLCIRGSAFVLICLGLAWMLGLPRGIKGTLAVGLVFTLVSGVAPLLMPNPFFPDSVRVHFWAVSSENFVFGAIVAWLWG